MRALHDPRRSAGTLSGDYTLAIYLTTNGSRGWATAALARARAALEVSYDSRHFQRPAATGGRFGARFRRSAPVLEAHRARRLRRPPGIENRTDGHGISSQSHSGQSPPLYSAPRGGGRHRAGDRVPLASRRRCASRRFVTQAPDARPSQERRLRRGALPFGWKKQERDERRIGLPRPFRCGHVRLGRDARLSHARRSQAWC
jgi:hypothetical protein